MLAGPAGTAATCGEAGSGRRAAWQRDRAEWAAWRGGLPRAAAPAAFGSGLAHDSCLLPVAGPGEGTDQWHAADAAEAAAAAAGAVAAAAAACSSEECCDPLGACCLLAEPCAAHCQALRSSCQASNCRACLQPQFAIAECRQPS